jgi:hypothetical protein
MADTGKQVLQVNNKLMELNDEYKPQAIVEVIEAGPLKITGNIILKDLQRDKEDTSKEIFLCRCGLSDNKPYCDGSHKK